MKICMLVLFVLFVIDYQIYSQVVDMDNRNYHYSLKNLGVFGFKKELNQTLNIFNHGIFYHENRRVDYKMAGGFSSTIWIENENVGRLPSINEDVKVYLKPYYINNILSKKGVNRFNSTGQVSEVMINNLTLELYEYLTKKLNINNLIEINEVNGIDYLEISNGIFRAGFLERSERLLQNKIKVSTEDFYVVPIFIQLEENKDNYLHVELQFFYNYKLLFKTSVSVVFNPPFLDETRLINSEQIQREIIASLFHQIRYE